MRMENDIVEAFEDAVEGRISEGDFVWSPDASACVVVTSGGYPAAFATGKPISGLDAAGQVPGVKIFPSGTALDNGQLVTNAGRVLSVTAAAPNLDTALDRCYEAIAKIHFEGMYYRKDIGRHTAAK
jgi:phosphoribosylamine---glycine ligase